jgi:hypothetical protein
MLTNEDEIMPVATDNSPREEDGEQPTEEELEALLGDEDE